MKIFKMVDPVIIIIFGGTGDLARRKLIPALYNLYCDNRLPARFELIGIGRSDLDQEQYRERLLEELGMFSRKGVPESESWACFSPRISYLCGDIENKDTFLELKERIDGINIGFGEIADRLYYLSIQPHLVPLVIRYLKQNWLAERVHRDKIVIEKPFGRDLASANQLKKHLSEAFSETQIYRIDHYLGKETMQNLLSFRFANDVFQPLWNSKYISSIDINLAEKVGLEGRGNYFETAGALRDMVLNHLIQILSLVTMEEPERLEADHIRDQKLKVIQAIRPISSKDVCQYVSRGQYGPGVVDGKDVAGYLEEEGVSKLSKTETFVAVKLFIDNARWSGVSFNLRTGKRLMGKSSSITVHFKRIKPSLLDKNFFGMQAANVLRIDLEPGSGIAIQRNAHTHAEPAYFSNSEMILDLALDPRKTPEDYETLLIDVVNGNPALFMRADLVEVAWKVITPILEGWRLGSGDMLTYAAGSSGPEKLEDDATLIKILKKATIAATLERGEPSAFSIGNVGSQ